MRRRSRQEREYVFEYKTITVQFSESYTGLCSLSMEDLTEMIGDGWVIDDRIICPPFAMLILWREVEKESKENDR